MTTKSITCPFCKMTSYNPNDIEQRYCGNCHAFHDDISTFKSFSFSEDSCGRCGLTPAEGYAKMGGTRYCHGDQEEPTCYVKEVTLGESGIEL